MLQNDLTQAQNKVKKVENRLSLQQQACTSDSCKRSVSDSEQAIQRKNKEIYDLTVKLGCLESENAELKSQIEDKDSIYRSRIDSSRLIAEQDLEDARRSISKLTESLAQQQKN